MDPCRDIDRQLKCIHLIDGFHRLRKNAAQTACDPNSEHCIHNTIIFDIRPDGVSDLDLQALQYLLLFFIQLSLLFPVSQKHNKYPVAMFI